VVAFAVRTAAFAPVMPASKKMNVLFLIADNLNDALGFQGHPLVRSPNTDRAKDLNLRITVMELKKLLHDAVNP